MFYSILVFITGFYLGQNIPEPRLEFIIVPFIKSNLIKIMQFLDNIKDKDIEVK